VNPPADRTIPSRQRGTAGPARSAAVAAAPGVTDRPDFVAMTAADEAGFSIGARHRNHPLSIFTRSSP